MIFMQIVKNTSTVGRGMTIGSDSLPLVSLSDIYQPLRNRNNRSYVEETWQILARLDLVSQVVWKPYRADRSSELLSAKCLAPGTRGSGTIS